MLRLVETIKVEDRRFFHLDYHSRRMNRSRTALFGLDDYIDLESLLTIPEGIGAERHKCRVIYSRGVESVAFEPYVLRSVRSLKAVDGSDINYEHKYVDRASLTNLARLKGGCDDVLICVGDRITDTTYANVALSDGSTWYTPETCLLQGTRRARLIDEGILIVQDVRISDLGSFQDLALINAMIDIGECVLPVAAIEL